MQDHQAHGAWRCEYPGRAYWGREQPEAALHREAREELGIVPLEMAYVCTLLHRAQEFHKLHYFAVTWWEGAITPQEADAVVWLPLTSLQTLDLDVGRLAVQEYLRVYTSGVQCRHAFRAVGAGAPAVAKGLVRARGCMLSRPWG